MTELNPYIGNDELDDPLYDQVTLIGPRARFIEAGLRGMFPRWSGNVNPKRFPISTVLWNVRTLVRRQKGD